MKRNFLSPPLRAVLPGFLVLCCVCIDAFPLPLGLPGFSADLLWTGSFEYDGYLIDRGDMRLRALKPGLLLRAQVLDKRRAPPQDTVGEGFTDFAAGLYHGATGSRLLWGILDEYGLPARIRNPWIRGMPYTEAHQSTFSDLKTEPSSTKENAAYLYLGSPWLGPVRAFGSVALESNLQAAFDVVLEAMLGETVFLRAEGFYTGYRLPRREASTWFSEKAPLPERDFSLLAGSLFFDSPFFEAAADLAWSQTFAFGDGIYGNMALRIGDRPWRFSFAADAAGSRFVGRDGGNPGAGFRSAAKAEWRGKRSRLFRTSVTLRSPAVQESFVKSSALFYYHFSAAPARTLPLLWPSHASLDISRDASEPEETLDSLEGSFGFKVWRIPLTLRGKLTGMIVSDVPPFPFPGRDWEHSFYSAKINAGASYSIGPFSFKTGLGWVRETHKSAKWETSLSAAVQGKPGRFRVQVKSADFPRDWSLDLSWRLQL
jgi:hypothetical protein